MDRLESTVERMLRIGSCVPFTHGVFTEARILEAKLDLRPQDAIVLASVLLHARTSDPSVAKCFANPNSKDFDSREIHAELGKHNCKLIGRFVDAQVFVKSRSD